MQLETDVQNHIEVFTDCFIAPGMNDISLLISCAGLEDYHATTVYFYNRKHRCENFGDMNAAEVLKFLDSFLKV